MDDQAANVPRESGLSISAWKTFLAVMGPGLVVMLADTDVGSIITAAQSGVQWGYQLLLLQILLMPVLYIVQELTVRLGIFTGKGHGELIRDTFGAALGLGFGRRASAIATRRRAAHRILRRRRASGELYRRARARHPAARRPLCWPSC